MLRTIAGVIVGYIVMAVCVVVALTAGFTLLGDDWAFEAGSYRTSMQWALLMLGAGLVAAVIGGLVCGVVSGRRRGAVVALALVVLVLGAVDTVVRLTAPEPTEAELVRTEDTPVFEAASKAKPPTWMGFANPVAGVVGVLLGGSLVGAGRKLTAD